jgi:hypothetical protein
MIFGHFTIENIGILIGGIISAVVGVGLLKWRAEFERAAADIQRGLGRVGQRVASRPQRWATVVVGYGFIAFGILFVCLGMFADLAKGGSGS